MSVPFQIDVYLANDCVRTIFCISARKKWKNTNTNDSLLFGIQFSLSVFIFISFLIGSNLDTLVWIRIFLKLFDLSVSCLKAIGIVILFFFFLTLKNQASSKIGNDLEMDRMENYRQIR